MCDELRIARSTFYDWRQKGRGPRCIRLPNGSRRIRRGDFENWLMDCEDHALPASPNASRTAFAGRRGTKSLGIDSKLPWPFLSCRASRLRPHSVRSSTPGRGLLRDSSLPHDRRWLGGAPVSAQPGSPLPYLTENFRCLHDLCPPPLLPPYARPS
ncbi:helix-turn-helix transcriptional regulator [Streptomyces niveus]|uniref:helix-turn-helix transcriptional regulator n=1 Tax=Streptomyces niveus TaxID=193462 RepID=UPI003F4D97D1